MARTTNGPSSHRRRKRRLELAKGFRGGRSKLYRTAKDAVAKSLTYAYRDRKNKKREFRSLWITRISAGCRAEGMSYSRFMNGLKKANIEMNRKALSNLAIEDRDAFRELVGRAKKALE